MSNAMSGFWATVRRRRGSSNTNLASAESQRPPSGRSSASRESQRDREGDATIDDVDLGDYEAVDKGCMNMSRMSRMSRMTKQIRLPSSFHKLRTLSLQRHAPLSNDTQTPTTGRHLKPPSPSSGSLSRKSFGKRAASSSPSRIEESNEKRKAFRGLSTERFVSQMPDQFKNLLRRKSSKQNSEKEDINPSKPSRRPGPVGKKWVKVFDDITYMDEYKKEDEPILGYTGRPTKVPDAYPLPVEPLPPTPPPKRSTLPRPREPSVESEYDNVTPKATKSALDDKENIPVGENKVESKSKSQRQGRSRDGNRFKGKRQKRLDTPVRSEGLGCDDGDMSDDSIVLKKDTTNILQEALPSKPPRGNKIYETIKDVKRDEIVETEMTPEIKPPLPPRGYKVYETIKPIEQEWSISSDVKPAKPPRGNKLYETIEVGKQVERIEPTIEIKTVGSNEARFESEPPRPRRGIKIYETIEIRREPITKDIQVTSENKTDPYEIESASVSEIAPHVITESKMETEEIESAVESDIGPDKPKRGVKMYETVNFSRNYVKVEEMESKKESIDNAPSESETVEKCLPEKPARGMKLYSDIVLCKEEDAPNKNENKLEITEEKTEIIDNVENKKGDEEETKITEEGEKITENEGENLKFMDSSSVDSIATEDKSIAPPYAKVLKDAKTKELRPVSEYNLDSSEFQDDSVPPPIPPKKKGIRAITPKRQTEDALYDIVPPRPARHLKPRIRSLDPSPSRPKRQRIISMDGKGTKIYTGIEFNTLNETRNKETTSLPGKPSRRRLPAPPRKKRHVPENPLTARLTLDPEKGATVTMDSQSENYENLDLQAMISSQKDQSILATLSSVEASSADTTKQNSLPLKSSNRTENGVSDSAPIESDAQDKHSLSVHVGKQSEVGVPGARVSQLETDIDLNLKNIESSFEQLDSVLKTLSSYSRKSPSNLMLGDKKVRKSCDVICDIVSTKVSSESELNQAPYCVSAEKGGNKRDIISSTSLGSGSLAEGDFKSDITIITDHTIETKTDDSHSNYNLINSFLDFSSSKSELVESSSGLDEKSLLTESETNLTTNRTFEQETNESSQSTDKLTPNESIPSDIESVEDDPDTVIENRPKYEEPEKLQTTVENKVNESEPSNLIKISEITENIAEVHLEIPVSENIESEIVVEVATPVSVGVQSTVYDAEEAIVQNTVIEEERHQAQESVISEDHSTASVSTASVLESKIVEQCTESDIQKEEETSVEEKQKLSDASEISIENEKTEAEQPEIPKTFSGIEAGQLNCVDKFAEELASKTLFEVDNKFKSEIICRTDQIVFSTDGEKMESDEIGCSISSTDVNDSKEEETLGAVEMEISEIGEASNIEESEEATKVLKVGQVEVNEVKNISTKLDNSPESELLLQQIADKDSSEVSDQSFQLEKVSEKDQKEEINTKVKEQCMESPRMTSNEENIEIEDKKDKVLKAADENTEMEQNQEIKVSEEISKPTESATGNGNQRNEENTTEQTTENISAIEISIDDKIKEVTEENVELNTSEAEKNESMKTEKIEVNPSITFTAEGKDTTDYRFEEISNNSEKDSVDVALTEVPIGENLKESVSENKLKEIVDSSEIQSTESVSGELPTPVVENSQTTVNVTESMEENKLCQSETSDRTEKKDISGEEKPITAAEGETAEGAEEMPTIQNIREGQAENMDNLSGEDAENVGGDLEAGFSALANRLEGIRSQLEAVITNYTDPTPTQSDASPPSSATDMSFSDLL